MHHRATMPLHSILIALYTHVKVRILTLILTVWRDQYIDIVEYMRQLARGPVYDIYSV